MLKDIRLFASVPVITAKKIKYIELGTYTPVRLSQITVTFVGKVLVVFLLCPQIKFNC